MLVIDWFYVVHGLKNWGRDTSGTALMEAVMLFPVLITTLMGVYDVGNVIVLNQKTITSSQVAADLIARNATTNTGSLNEAIDGARLAYEPYQISNFGIDVASIRFDALRRPEILWRHTEGMAPNQAAIQSIDGLSEEGEGMVIVTVRYSYTPHFGQMFVNQVPMQEVAYARGRRSATVQWR